MNTKHAKSTCCQAKVRNFGRKRRQCGACKRTWSIRPRRRGRKPRRPSQELVQQVISKGYTLRLLGKRHRHIRLPNLRHWFRRSLLWSLRTPLTLSMPDGPLVLLADGLHFRFNGKPWTLYLMALRPCPGSTAFFLDPVLFSGNESAAMWELVIESIPSDLLQRIQALVVDDLPGMGLLAKRKKWILQLCQFHLFLRLRAHDRPLHYARKGGNVRQDIDTLVRSALKAPSDFALYHHLSRIETIVYSPATTRRIRGILRHFTLTAKSYRAHLIHPDLQLPNTNNTLESMGNLIRTVLRRHHSATRPTSLLLWATAFIRSKRTLICNGK